MKITIVVPVYNEEAIIEETLTILSEALSKIGNELDWEIVVADNASTDKTAEKVKNAGFSKVKVFSIKEKGKGVAIRSVAMESEDNFFGFIDADLSADPEAIFTMLDALKKGECDIVIGSRLMDKTQTHRSFLRTLSSEVFNFIQRIILGLDIQDTQCGLKIMNRRGIDIFKKCKENSWFFDMEFLALSSKNGLRILEVPVLWEEFRYKDRKTKLHLVRDGFSAIITMIRIRIRLNKE